MVDLICNGLLVLQGAQIFKACEKYKMKSSSQQWDSNPVPSAYEAEALPIAPWDLTSTIRQTLKAFYITCAIDMYHVIDLENDFVLYNICIVLKFDQTEYRSLLTVKC